MKDLNFWAGSGMSAVTLERAHQIDLGYDVNHDAKHHTPEELFSVGRCYVDFGVNQQDDQDQDEPHPFWPETTIEWVPEPTPLDYIVKGTAFLIAAMDLKQAKEMSR